LGVGIIKRSLTNLYYHLQVLISVSELSSKWSVKPIGVLHVGAHEAEEWPEYKKSGWLPICWIEAQEHLVTKLREELPRESNQIYKGAVWGSSHILMKFNISSNSQSSSLLEFGSHSKNYPKIRNIETVEVQSIRIDELIGSENKFDFINLDIQGSELEALKGMGNLLNGVKWIYCEVNSEQTYVGCPHVSEIDAFLQEKGFKRISTVWIRGKGWGDALYAKREIARKHVLKTFIRNTRNYLANKKYKYAKVREIEK